VGISAVVKDMGVPNKDEVKEFYYRAVSKTGRSIAHLQTEKKV